jgi:peptide/nickel transport system ATP-binding protein
MSDQPAANPVEAASEPKMLQLKDLKMFFPITKGLFGGVKGYVKAADEVSFSIRKRETLGLVGESGCGKTTVGRCVVRAYQATSGEILFQNSDGSLVDLAGLKGPQLQPYRRQIRMIFQDPYSSLNPRMNVMENISEVLYVNKMGTPAERRERVAQMLERVGLRPEYMHRYPHAFSGGERQRISIARSLITNPRLVVCDEAVSALDVSIRAQILNLLEKLQADFDLTYLFISHDLSVIRHICDRVVVMYVGRVVEISDALELFVNPLHPYTEALMSAVPVANPKARHAGSRILLQGEIADPSNTPSGCYFHPRCRYAQERCKIEAPPLRELSPGHAVACHFAEQLDLSGVRMVD